MNRVTDEVEGRWKEILPQLGIHRKFLTGRNIACPVCGGKDRFVYSDRTKNGDYLCRQCGAGQGLSLVMKVNGWDARTAVKAIRQVIGGTYKPERLDWKHRIARKFFNSCPDAPEPYEPPKSTREATLWLRKHHPERLQAWLDRHDHMLAIWLQKQEEVHGISTERQ